MSAAVTPSVEAFVAAQSNMRSLLGTTAQFLIPLGAVWAEGTRINPDSGLPYDATIQPVGDAFTTVEKTILIIVKQGSPLRPQSDTFWEQAGDMTGMDIIVDIDASDMADVEDASEMTINGLRYKIEEAKPFSMASTLYRYLIYGKER